MIKTLEEKEKLKKRIQYLRDVQKFSFRQIAEELGIHRKTASKFYQGLIEVRRPKSSALDPYQELIAYWFKQHPRLKAI